jgi:hypothetical protein
MCKDSGMKAENLSKKQEARVASLGNCIFTEAELFQPRYGHLLVRIPFSTLKEIGVNSLAEARNLIEYLDSKIITLDSDITILNGRIFQDGKSIVVFFGNSKQPLYGVRLDDEENNLVLWVDGIEELKENFKKVFTYIPEGSVAKFNEKQSMIVFGNKEISLPPTKNEFNLCKAMFEYAVNEPVDWSVVWNAMENLDPGFIPEKSNKKSLRDTSDRVNSRMKETLGLKKSLFTWKNKNISRNF